MSALRREPAGIERRAFLRGAAALPLALAVSESLSAADKSGPSGLIVREKDPENLEFPFAALDGALTPNESFFIRSHFAVPKLEAKSWRLKVEGLVERSLELTYDDLLKMPSRTVPALIECAGNSRVFLTPKAKGLQWEMGAVGNAEWTGVPLAAVLATARIKEGAIENRATEVVLEGADTGEIREDPKSAGVIPFARSLPFARARAPEVLLAYKMNGAELPPSHGFPVRVVVPGWYGMAAVKWLSRIVVIDRPFLGYFQSIDYTVWDRRDGLASLVPVTELQVKAAVARPAVREAVKAGSAYRVFGAAWAGAGEVERVEVSTDGGKTWAKAKLLGEPVRWSWRLWEYEWRVPSRPGPAAVVARATDKDGRTQPDRRDPDRRGYAINHLLPIEVEVR